MNILPALHNCEFAPYFTFIETDDLPYFETDTFEPLVNHKIIHNFTLRFDINVAIEILIHARNHFASHIMISPKPWDINPSLITDQATSYTTCLYPAKLSENTPQPPKYIPINALNHLNYAICFNDLTLNILYNTTDTDFNYHIQTITSDLKIIKNVSEMPKDSTPFIDPHQHLISLSTMK